MNARRARQRRYAQATLKAHVEAVQTGMLRHGTMRDLEAGGAVDADVGMIVMDFVKMGRSAPAARRGLAAAIWRRRPKQRIAALLPEGSHPLGSEPLLNRVGWFRSEELSPFPSRCDVCGQMLPGGAAWGAWV